MKIQFKTKTSATVSFAALCAVFILTIRYSDAMRQGTAEALNTSMTMLIPSLFPMLILSSLAASAVCPDRIKKISAPVLRRLFGLSPGCILPLLLGLFCGYPLAAKTASAAYDIGSITEEDAKRLTLFFTSPGIPFSVTVTGAGFFGSRPVGRTLFAACVSADILCAVIYNILFRAPDGVFPEKKRKPSPFSERLIISVENAIRSMMSVCAWIGAFYAVLAVVNSITGSGAGKYISLVSEITSAVKIAADAGSAAAAAFCLSFGGICVFCQLVPDIRKNRTGAVRYLTVRGISGAAAYLFERLLLRGLHIAVPSDARLGAFYLAGNSAAGSAALLFACAVFMFELSSKNRPTQKSRKKIR